MKPLQDDSDSFYILETHESFEDAPNEDFDTDSNSIPLDGCQSILLAGATRYTKFSSIRIYYFVFVISSKIEIYSKHFKNINNT